MRALAPRPWSVGGRLMCRAYSSRHNTTYRCPYASCQRLQVVHLPNTVVCLQHGAFRRCYLLRAVLAPGCRQFGIKVFEACCSLTQIGATNHTTNQLAPQAQLRPRAFEKCTALRHLNLEMTEYDPTNPKRCLPKSCFLKAGVVSLSLPPDFTWVAPAACERCQQLQTVICPERTLSKSWDLPLHTARSCNNSASPAICEE